MLEEARQNNWLVTGLIYIDKDKPISDGACTTWWIPRSTG